MNAIDRKVVEGLVKEFEFIMTYKCEKCGENWQTQHDCACDDRCPSCDLAHEPMSVEDVK